LTYEIRITTKCKKDIKLASKQGKNINLLFEIVYKLSEGIALEPKYKDHKLSGKYEGMRECHIDPDFLLVYGINDKELVLYLLRVGSHSSIF